MISRRSRKPLTRRLLEIRRKRQHGSNIRRTILPWTIIGLVVLNAALVILFLYAVFAGRMTNEFRKYITDKHLYAPPLLASLYLLMLKGAKRVLERSADATKTRMIRQQLLARIRMSLSGGLSAAVIFAGVAVTCAQIWAITSICDPKPKSPGPYAVDQIALSDDERLVFVPDRNSGIAVFAPLLDSAKNGEIKVAPQGVLKMPFNEISDKYHQVDVITLKTPGTSVGQTRGVVRAPNGRYLYVVSGGDETAGEEENGTLSIVDLRSYQVIKRIEVGHNPRWIAVSPGGERIYVSNVNSTMDPKHGSISVIDANDQTLKAKIDGVNCPEGLALSPDGKRLYVASQCGDGHDPLFIVDTTTNSKVGQIPGLAVGNSVLVSKDGKKVYVTRANFMWHAQGKTGAPLSVIDTESNRIIKTFVLQTSTVGLALTPDGRYLLATNGYQISIVDTSTDELVKNVSLREYGSSIAVRSDAVVIVTVSGKRRLVTFPLGKALESWPCVFPGT